MEYWLKRLADFYDWVRYNYPGMSTITQSPGKVSCNHSERVTLPSRRINKIVTGAQSVRFSSLKAFNKIMGEVSPMVLIADKILLHTYLLKTKKLKSVRKQQK
jgi:hypothetical protein